MRRMRFILLAVIALVIAGVGFTYYVRLARETGAEGLGVEKLPPGIEASMKEWQYTFYQGKRPSVEVRARKLMRLQDPERLELEGVQLKIFDETGQRFDRVESERAQFDAANGVLYSDGEVEIQLAQPREEIAGGHLVAIRSSGVSFDGKTGGAHTERAAWFRFENGEGKSTGATYDPVARELSLHRDVSIQWRGGSAKGRPGMTIEGGGLVYKELESKVYLTGWSRLKQRESVVDGGDAVVNIESGKIRRIDARNARGVTRLPTRQIEYGADDLHAEMSDEGQIEKLTGTGNATLDTRSAVGRNSVKAGRLDLQFTARPDAGESVLREALAMGNTVVEMKPAARKDGTAPESRRLSADAARLYLRDDGSTLDRMETLSPGVLEFLPSRPTQPYRRLEADRMWMEFGQDNQLKSYRAGKVKTLTRLPAKPNPADPKARPVEPPARLTSSQDLLAGFEEKTGEMIKLEQWTDFQYEEGPRRATGDKGVMEGDRKLLIVEGNARVSDASGVITASRIEMNQESGEVNAEGKVSSTRVDPKGQGAPGLLTAKEALQARAERMTTRDNNRWIRYEGNALLWQGPDRISAREIVIDRKAGELRATGDVVTLLRERGQAQSPSRTESPKTEDAQGTKPPAAAGAEAGGGAPRFINVSAGQLVYQEKESVADYRGGVVLLRGPVEVRADRIRAFFQEQEGGDKELDRALADGNAVIRRADPGRTRTGTADHAEYHVREEKAVLYGGAPMLVDSLRGTTRGERLTYYSADDRLAVGGTKGAPAVTRILRK